MPMREKTEATREYSFITSDLDADDEKDYDFRSAETYGKKNDWKRKFGLEQDQTKNLGFSNDNSTRKYNTRKPRLPNYAKPVSSANAGDLKFQSSSSSSSSGLGKF